MSRSSDVTEVQWNQNLLYVLMCAGERAFTLIPVQPCDSSGVVTAHFLLTSSPGRVAVATATSSTDPQVGTGRPRRTGSLALFFRKVGAGERLVEHP